MKWTSKCPIHALPYVDFYLDKEMKGFSIPSVNKDCFLWPVKLLLNITYYSETI